MPEFHTELQHLTQQQLQLLQQENQALSSYLQVMKDEIKDANNTIALQQTYQVKLQQLIEQLNSELQYKDQQIQQYQHYLSNSIELPEQENLSNQLAPLLEKCLDSYLSSASFHGQIEQQIEAKLAKYSSTLEQLQAINWAELYIPEKSIERELDKVLNEATSLTSDLRELIHLYQKS